MYLALFLIPWMMIYALSTIVMNHGEYFRKHYGGDMVSYTKQREQIYTGTFVPGAGPRMIARQILRSLGMDGAYHVKEGPDAGRITIYRHEPLSLKRITYSPSDGKLLIEREVFRTQAFLERLHRRSGYKHEFLLEDAWAFSVDLVIAALVFWSLSGLWMWWEMRLTRRWGAVCVAASAGIFCFFLISI